MNVYTERQILKILRDWVDTFDKQYMAAKKLRISKSYLCEIYKGRRTLSDTVLQAMGFTRQIVKVKRNKIDNEYRTKRQRSISKRNGIRPSSPAVRKSSAFIVSGKRTK